MKLTNHKQCTTISIILGAYVTHLQPQQNKNTNKQTKNSIAWARTTTLYLPLPISLSATTTILPILTPILLFLARFLSNQSTTGANTPTFRNRFITSVISYLLTILPSGLATLALTYLFAPDLLVCQLNNQWQSYYHNKDSRAIRAIQDSLHCCGFRSVKDRAWPFKDRTHDDDACVEQIGYARACLGPWEQEDKGAAWMVLWAAVLILVVKVCLNYICLTLLLGSSGADWLWIDGLNIVDRELAAESQPRLDGESKYKSIYQDFWCRGSGGG